MINRSVIPATSCALAIGLGNSLPARADVISDWNQTACDVVAKLGPGAPGHRMIALAQVAVFEAVNAIDPPGHVVSYHVFQVNNPRNGEPDLILAIESKDYLTNAEQLALQKKYEAFMAMDQRKMQTAGGERKVMRKLVGNMELQELNLK